MADTLPKCNFMMGSTQYYGSNGDESGQFQSYMILFIVGIILSIIFLILTGMTTYSRGIQDILSISMIVLFIISVILMVVGIMMAQSIRSRVAGNCQYNPDLK